MEFFFKHFDPVKKKNTFWPGDNWTRHTKSLTQSVIIVWDMYIRTLEQPSFIYGQIKTQYKTLFKSQKLITLHTRGIKMMNTVRYAPNINLCWNMLFYALLEPKNNALKWTLTNDNIFLIYVSNTFYYYISPISP